MPQPATRQHGRALKDDERAFDTDIRRILELATVGFKYEPPKPIEDQPDQTDQYATQLYEFMVAESYLLEVQGGYMVTTSGRQHRQHLRRKPLIRWLSSNYQWLTAVTIAIASVAVATASLVVAACN